MTAFFARLALNLIDAAIAEYCRHEALRHELGEINAVTYDTRITNIKHFQRFCHEKLHVQRENKAA